MFETITKLMLKTFALAPGASLVCQHPIPEGLNHNIFTALIIGFIADRLMTDTYMHLKEQQNTNPNRPELHHYLELNIIVVWQIHRKVVERSLFH